MKKCLRGWVRGDFNFHTKFSAEDIENVSMLLRQCNASRPSEIHRAVRGLDTIAFWKGLEFRTFLLYIGPVVLRDYLPNDAYTHFLHLFCAARICSSEKYFNIPQYQKVAESLFHDYIEQYIDLYGIDSISSNVHNLCHIVDDVKRFGILPKISAYPFENMLFSIKNLLRSGRLPLSQVANRLNEMSHLTDINYARQVPEVFPYLSKKIDGEADKFAKICFDGFVLTNKEQNRWFLTKSNEIVQMNYATTHESGLVVYGCKVKHSWPFFAVPFDSTFIKVFSSDGALHMIPKSYSTRDIECKLFALNYRDGRVFVPLLHTFDNFTDNK